MVSNHSAPQQRVTRFLSLQTGLEQAIKKVSAQVSRGTANRNKVSKPGLWETEKGCQTLLGKFDLGAMETMVRPYAFQVGCAKVRWAKTGVG